MYGRDEHRYYTRELGDVNAALDNARQKIADLLGEVSGDFSGQARFENRVQVERERDTIATMSVARVMVGEAMQAVDRAIRSLPKPVATVTK